MTDDERQKAWDARMVQWWADWRAEDYSWDGLDKRYVTGDPRKPWQGWVWSEAKQRAYEADQAPKLLKTIPASLQHYWRERFRLQGWAFKDCLITSPDGTETYSLVHLPSRWKDGSLTDAVARPGDAMTLINAALASTGDTVFKEGLFPGPEGTDRRAQLGGAIIPGSPDQGVLADGTPIIRADCTRAHFVDDLDWSSPEEGPHLILEHARFRNAAFSGIAGFDNVAFSGNATFDSAAFSGDANFDSAAFSGEAWFYSAAFSRDATFYSAAFSGDARFDSAAFSGEAWFYSAAFSGYASFYSAAFSEFVEFDNAAFSGNANFDSAAFSWLARFDSAHFGGPVSFAGAAEGVVAPALKRDLRLAPVADAEAGTLGGDVTQASELLPLARRAFRQFSAEGAVFIGDADFSNRAFLTPHSFRGTTFLGMAKFHGARLHPGVNLHDTQFRVLDHERPPLAGWRRSWHSIRRWIGRNGTDLAPFPQASSRLMAAAGRTDRAAWQAATDQKRHAALLRIQSDLVRQVRADLEQRGQPDPGLARVAAMAADRRVEEIERSFRTLKQAMQDIRSRRMESHFFKLELKARRRLKADRMVPWWERTLSWLYGKASDYGDSVFLPLLWLLAIWFGFGFLYWLLAPWAAGATMAGPDDLAAGSKWLPGLGDALQYSAGRTTLFGAVSGDPDWAWLSSWNAPDADRPFWWGGAIASMMRALAMIQSFTAVVLFFLSALAVRRKFQIT